MSNTLPSQKLLESINELHILIDRLQQVATSMMDEYEELKAEEFFTDQEVSS